MGPNCCFSVSLSTPQTSLSMISKTQQSPAWVWLAATVTVSRPSAPIKPVPCPVTIADQRDAGQGIGVPLTRPKEDKLFVVQANMGTPPQGPLLLIVDTGSSSLVVFATEAPLDTTTLVLITVPALAVLASCVFACFFFRKCMCSGCDSNYQSVPLQEV
mmetsp:Transcript_49768/g.116996  ORF Transcript_49768/g.116996 Transcript_49768/m.116996 type:complete len:159 (-) Transcript_49768:207-683(-)